VSCADHFEVTVRGEEAGKRIDTFLGQTEQLASRSAAARLVEGGFVRVNGSLVSKRHIIRAGETITVDVPPAVGCGLEPEDIPLDIRFEDDHMIVLSKQAGLVVHPAHGNWSGTLVHALLAHSSGTLGTLQGEERPGIVHRLDKETSGLLMIAKNDRVQAALSEAIRIRAIDRRYVALVHGYVAPDSGLIDAPIGRDQRDRKRMAVVESSSARQSVTTFKVLERFMAGVHDDGYTLLECKLYTGRTHQIRVHMAYIDHPVVGDQMYGQRRLKKDRRLQRQFLHACRLEFDHPVTGEHLVFSDPLPEDLRHVLSEIEPDSMGRTELGEEVLEELVPRG